MTKDADLRKTKRVQSNKIAIRETLQASEYLRQLESIANTVNEEWKSLTTEQIQSLKLLADINYKRLNKVLPDLKSIEMRNDEANKHERLLAMLDETKIIDIN